MKVAFSPLKVDGNKYIEMIVEPLKVKGIEVISLKKSIGSLSAFRGVDVLHINWYENLIGKSGIQRIADFIKKVLTLGLYKTFNKKVVWTMHNRSSHSKELPFLHSVLRNFIFKVSDRIIIHSKASLDILAKERKAKAIDKAVYIPHPNYIGIYGDRVTQHWDNIRGKEQVLNLLFMGAVKPYKNIELLISIARQHSGTVNLVIAGKPSSKTYQHELERQANGAENITLDFRFIDDGDIPQLLGGCDLVILPYDTRSSLNSGTVILAFSYGVSVICPLIGTVSDFEDRSNMIVYEYRQNMHFDILNEQVKKAILLKQQSPDIFIEWGKTLLEIMEEKYNGNLVVESLTDVYANLLNA